MAVNIYASLLNWRANLRVSPLHFKPQLLPALFSFPDVTSLPALMVLRSSFDIRNSFKESHDLSSTQPCQLHSSEK